jgi:hypothetical protein
LAVSANAALSAALRIVRTRFAVSCERRLASGSSGSSRTMLACQASISVRELQLSAYRFISGDLGAGTVRTGLALIGNRGRCMRSRGSAVPA